MWNVLQPDRDRIRAAEQGLGLGDPKELWENLEGQAYKLEHFLASLGAILMWVTECQRRVSALDRRMCVLAGTGGRLVEVW